MSNHLVRLYVFAAAILAFFVLWATVAAHPWAARALYDAFKQAHALAFDDLYDTDALRLGLPWLLDHIEETRAVFGEDWWRYGVEANRPTLTAVGQYVFEQGISPRVVTPEEMFAPGLG